MNALWQTTSEVRTPADAPVERHGAVPDRARGCDRAVLAATKLLKAFSIATVATLMLAAAGPDRAEASSTADAAHSVSLVNSVRTSKGLSLLAAQAALDEIAERHASEMAARNEIFHYTDIGARADAAGVNWTSIGENVGVGPDVRSVHEGFMASPGHYRNVVYAAYNVIGVGVAVGSDGSVFIAHEYAGIPKTGPSARNIAPHRSSSAVPVQAVPHPAARAPAPRATSSVLSQMSLKVSPLPNAIQDGHVNEESLP